MKFSYSLSHIDSSSVRSLEDISKMLFEHDRDSFVFSIGTAELNVAIGKEMGLSDSELFLLFQCGIYHDTGKLGMEYDFINFPDMFTSEMFEEMKKHTVGGAEILEKANAHQQIIETAKFHHCNYDGKGYVHQLKGDDIPLYARITRVSDSVDAYMSKRAYKKGGPAKEVLNDLKQFEGTWYDPTILSYFEKVHESIMRMCVLYGIDQPSHDLYMYFLHINYPTNFKKRELEDILYTL